MKVAKIADLANLADGSIIGEMSVQVKAAFPAKTGEGKYGPWRVQPCILKDSTGEVRASFWVKDELKDLVGQTITIKSQGGAKGLQGLSVKFNSHSDSNELNVTDKAAIIDSTAGAFRQAETANKLNAFLSSGQGGGTPADAKRLIFQRAQLYVECIKAAGWVTKQEAVTGEHFQAVVASLFISADKANLWNCFPATQAKLEAKAEVPDEIPMGGEDTDDFSKEAGW